MAVYYLPDVKDAAEHKALQQAVRNYPVCSFDEWRQVQDGEIDALRADRHKVRLVETTARDLLDYCDRTGIPCTAETLAGFLWDRGKRLRSGRRGGS